MACSTCGGGGKAPRRREPTLSRYHASERRETRSLPPPAPLSSCPSCGEEEHCRCGSERVRRGLRSPSSFCHQGLLDIDWAREGRLLVVPPGQCCAFSLVHAERGDGIVLADHLGRARATNAPCLFLPPFSEEEEDFSFLMGATKEGCWRFICPPRDEGITKYLKAKSGGFSWEALFEDGLCFRADLDTSTRLKLIGFGEALSDPACPDRKIFCAQRLIAECEGFIFPFFHKDSGEIELKCPKNFTCEDNRRYALAVKGYDITDCDGDETGDMGYIEPDKEDDAACDAKFLALVEEEVEGEDGCAKIKQCLKWAGLPKPLYNIDASASGLCLIVNVPNYYKHETPVFETTVSNPTDCDMAGYIQLNIRDATEFNGDIGTLGHQYLAFVDGAASRIMAAFHYEKGALTNSHPDINDALDVPDKYVQAGSMQIPLEIPAGESRNIQVFFYGSYDGSGVDMNHQRIDSSWWLWPV